MTTTDRPPLPLDWQALKAYLPAEPPDTGVSRARTIIGRLDAAVAEVRAELEEAEQRERSTAADLVAAAAEGHDLTPILTNYRPGTSHAEQRLQVLDLARTTAWAEQQRAERSDPTFLAWRQECQRISEAWQQAMAGEPEHRFEQLVRFTEAYGQTIR